MRRNHQAIEDYLEKATELYFQISDCHKLLVKRGYNKPFSVFLREIQARATYRKILSKR